MAASQTLTGARALRLLRSPAPRGEGALASITTSPTSVRTPEAGLPAGFGAYALWGFLPLLFNLLHRVDAVTVVADRTIWSLLFVGALLAVTRRFGDVRAALRDRQVLVRLLLAAVLLGSNWLIYVYGIISGQVLEVSLGYFINPLVNVVIGIVVLGEKQNRWQLLAIGIATVAIIVETIAVGHLPLIALGLALTFAAYGYIRKTVKAASATGLFVETLLLAPLALGYLAYTFLSSGSLGPHANPGTMGLLLLIGPATALPLLLFAFAVQRLRLTTMGMLQYISPSIAFVLAITVFGEPIGVTQLVCFALIWLSLLVFTADSLLSARRRAMAT